MNEFIFKTTIKKLILEHPNEIEKRCRELREVLEEIEKELKEK